MSDVRLSGFDRVLLFMPIPGAIAFGLSPVLFPTSAAHLVGFAGDDPYVLRLAGGGTFAFAIALALAIQQGAWLPARYLAVATVIFSVLAVPVCALELAAGNTRPVVYAFLVDSLVQVGAMGSLLLRYRSVRGGAPEISNPAVIRGLAGAAVIALGVGLLALLLPRQAAELFGYAGTDPIIYRLAGAETLGYAAMAFLMVRSRNWAEMRLPVVIAVVFNGLGLIATLISIAQGGPVLLPLVVLLVTVVVTPSGLWMLERGPLLASPDLATARPASTPAHGSSSVR